MLNLKFKISYIFIILYFCYVNAQDIDDSSLPTVIIDSAPKKLYSEIYSDKIGNQFLIEIYEEPQEGENLVHFRAFKNGEIIARKSQGLAESHNFEFIINETKDTN